MGLPAPPRFAPPACGTVPFCHVRGQTPDVAVSDRGGAGGTIAPMADQTSTVPLEQQLEEIGAQLAWVRDYL
jgi:hypothetical protein